MKNENRTMQFCRQAIRSGYLTRETARKVLKAHHKLAVSGKPKSIESICASAKIMTPGQIARVRSLMNDPSSALKTRTLSEKTDELPSPSTERVKNSPEVQWIQTIQIQASPAHTIKVETEERRNPTQQRLNINKRLVTLENAGKETSCDFTILKQIGKGGMAVVCAARQNALNRDIAFKMMRKEKKQKDNARSKFISEAVVTGNLDHPNIVPVHDLGRSKDGSLFYTMKNVTGTSWDRVIANNSIEENLEILFKVCDAVAFAHSRGILHRDLKPANVMLGDFGEVYVMDWGLAASVKKNGFAEHLGQNTGLAGTPAYMAPEMAKAQGGNIGIHSDVYLLGGILYEIKTHNRPHEGEDVFACILDAVNNNIRPPEKPDGLTRIALKAMSTSPEDRYPSVENFKQAILDYRSHAQSIVLAEKAKTDLAQAEENRDYDGFALSLFGFREALELWPKNETAQTGISEATLAYSACAHEKGDFDLALSLLAPDNPAHTDLIKKISTAKRTRENRRKRLKRMTYGAAAMAAAAIVILATAVFWVNAEKDRALRAEKAARTAQFNEKAQREKAERENYLNLIALADRKLIDFSMDQAKSLLDATAPVMRGWEWHRLMKMCSLELMTLKGHTDYVASVAFSPDGKWAATGSFDGTARIWEAETGKEKAVLPGHRNPVTKVWFSEDSTRVFTVGEQGYTNNWDVQTGKLLPLKAVSGKQFASSEAMSPDGRSMVVTKRGRDALVLSMPEGNRITVLQGHKDRVNAAAYAPDGRRIVTGSGDYTARIWDAKSGMLQIILAGHSQAVTAVAFSRDGRRVITGSWDKTAKIWDALSPQDALVLEKHNNYIHDLAFSPTGGRIITAGRDNTAIVWNALTGKEETRLTGHSAYILSVDFSPDGTRALTGSHDNMIRLWDLSTGKIIQTFSGHSHSVMSVDFSSSGRRAVSAGWDGTARIWTINGDTPALVLKGHKGPVLSAAFSPDEKTVATSGKDGTIRIWNAATGSLVTTLSGHQKAVYGIAYSPATSTLASASWDGSVRVWTIGANQAPMVLKGHTGAVHAVCYSPDGKRLVTGGWDRTVRLWDVEAGRELITLTGHTEAVLSVAFSSNGKQVASAGRDKTARIWKAMYGRAK